VQVCLLGGEVARARVGAGAFGGGVAVGGGPAADPGGDLGGFAGQDLAGLAGDPGFGVGIAGLEEAPGRLPEVFEDVSVRTRRVQGVRCLA
jgi:hypothetical protein